MKFFGKTWKPSTMLEAQKMGVSMILQEANTIPGISVAANIFAGQEKQFSFAGFVNFDKMAKAAEIRLKNLGIRAY